MDIAGTSSTLCGTKDASGALDASDISTLQTCTSEQDTSEECTDAYRRFLQVLPLHPLHAAAAHTCTYVNSLRVPML